MKLYRNLKNKKVKANQYAIFNGEKQLTEPMKFEDAVDMKYRLSKIEKFR